MTKPTYGTVYHGATPLQLQQDPYQAGPVDLPHYEATAVDAQGHVYSIVWQTTPQWRISDEHARLELELDLSHDADDRTDLTQRIQELESIAAELGGIVDTSEEGDACDWDIYEVVALDGDE